MNLKIDWKKYATLESAFILFGGIYFTLTLSNPRDTIVYMFGVFIGWIIAYFIVRTIWRGR